MAYKMFKNGFLPNDGGWLKQANKFNEIMHFIDNELELHKKEQEAKNGTK